MTRTETVLGSRPPRNPRLALRFTCPLLSIFRRVRPPRSIALCTIFPTERSRFLVIRASSPTSTRHIAASWTETQVQVLVLPAEARSRPRAPRTRQEEKTRPPGPLGPPFPGFLLPTTVRIPGDRPKTHPPCQPWKPRTLIITMATTNHRTRRSRPRPRSQILT